MSSAAEQLPVALSGPSLVRAGWDDDWSVLLDAVRPGLTSSPARPGLLERFPGRVSRADRGGCEVLAADRRSPNDLVCVSTTWGPGLAADIGHDPTAVPAAGDWVVVAAWRDASGERLTTETVLPRRTAVVRAQAAAGSSHGQVLAANVDVVAVVEGMAPDPDPGRLERLLALAWASGARPVVVLTKADLVRVPADFVDDVTQLAPGVDVLAVASTTGEGLEPLRGWLAQGCTLALVGASGVGKSTLLNSLLAPSGVPSSAEVMRTQALRTDGKGRHTTVTRELHLAPGGGAVLDTPGLRSIGLFGNEALDEVFSEIEELGAGCRFRDCTHTREPGCAVLAAVDSGELAERRLASYRKLLREVEYQASRVDARVRAARTDRWKAIHRQARQRGSRP